MFSHKWSSRINFSHKFTAILENLLIGCHYPVFFIQIFDNSFCVVRLCLCSDRLLFVVGQHTHACTSTNYKTLTIVNDSPWTFAMYSNIFFLTRVAFIKLKKKIADTRCCWIRNCMHAHVKSMKNHIKCKLKCNNCECVLSVWLTLLPRGVWITLFLVHSFQLSYYMSMIWLTMVFMYMRAHSYLCVCACIYGYLVNAFTSNDDALATKPVFWLLNRLKQAFRNFIHNPKPPIDSQRNANYNNQTEITTWVLEIDSNAMT